MKITWGILCLAILSTGMVFEGPDNCKQVLELASFDSEYTNEVDFCWEESLGYHFVSEIKTAVCSDKLCRLAELVIYWDPAGNYLKFDTINGRPLTKYEHDPFTSEDYEKLHQAFSNPNSILGEKTHDELIDNDVQRYSAKIDGWTGATQKELKSVVVDGALYSTYTLWNMVNGDMVENMRSYTKSNYSPQLEKQLLTSDNSLTVMFAVKQFSEEDYINQFEEMLTLILNSDPLLGFYIAKKLPKAALENSTNRLMIHAILDSLNSNTRSILEGKLQQMNN